MQMTRVLTAALVVAGSSLAESVDALKWPDIGVFGGYQGWSLWRSKFSSRPGGELATGGVAGARAGYDLTSHLGLEGAYTYGVNNLRLFRDGSSTTEFGARNHHLSLNPLWHFSGPDSKLRPYVTAGLGAVWFKPSEEARRDIGLPVNAGLGALGMKTDLMPAFNWGGGVKYNLTRLVQLRFDARNVITRQPHFGLPPNNVIPGGVFVSNGGVASGLQATAGIGFSLSGDHAAPAAAPARSAAAVPPAAAPRASRNGKALRVNLTGGATPIPSAGAVKLIATTDAPDQAAIKYVWTVNGMGTDVTGPEFAFNAKGREPGDYKICGTATSTNKDWTPGSECYTVTVEPIPALKASLSEPVRINSGESTQFTAGSDAPAGETVTYEWTLNGQPIPNATGPTLVFNSDGRQPAVYDICVTASAHGATSQKQCSSANVVACTNPGIAIGALPAAEVFAGEKVNIPVTAQPGSCGGPVQISYRAADGLVTGSGNTGVFDSTNVAFDRTNRSKLQRKSVPVTVTATDNRGNTATAQTSIVVKLASAAQRLDDVLFAAGNSRVNNCGKRVLLEMLTPRLRDDPEAKVVLIGHIDESEHAHTPAVTRTRNGRRVAAPARQLDKARVLNAAAVISGGEGICPSLELSRVKVAYAGKAQGASDLRPTFCGSSTEVRATKRAGAKPDTRAQYRRVEVWIVPNGAAMPPGVTVLAAPESEIKALKCPK